jgi:hypothetical protein
MLISKNASRKSEFPPQVNVRFDVAETTEPVIAQ